MTENRVSDCCIENTLMRIKAGENASVINKVFAVICTCNSPIVAVGDIVCLIAVDELCIN